MKNLARAFLLVLLLPLVAHAQWFTTGVQVNPPASTVLSDSGVFSATDPSSHQFNLVCATSVAAIIRLEHRDAANASNIVAQTLNLSASAPFTFTPLPAETFDPGERLRIIVVGAVVGSVQCSLFVN